MTLVVGATGLLGIETCRQLRGKGRPVRALVRRTADPARRAELEAIGAELIEGDLKDPASLARACAGVRSVITTASSTLSRQDGDSIRTVDEQGQISLVDAAKKAGVDHIVFVSFKGDPRIQSPLADAKRAAERHLKASGIAYTIVQASFFMEVWLSPMLGFDYAGGAVRIYGDGTNRLSWVSYKDVARVAVAALDVPAARRATIDAGGPAALSPHEVVEIFEAAGAAKITVEHVPEAALRSQREAATDPLQQSFAALMLQYAGGETMDMTRTLALFPMKLTSVRDYASSVLARS